MNNPLQDLEDKVGLHEEVTVIYVVDGFEATLYGQDGGVRRDTHHGATLMEALLGLNKKVKNENLST